jgi:isoquinoline 1-oxidoreductase alpha subunit
MILKAYNLLSRNAKPSRAEIIENMNVHLCRCGTYGRVIEAIQTAAAELKGGSR